VAERTEANAQAGGGAESSTAGNTAALTPAAPLGSLADDIAVSEVSGQALVAVVRQPPSTGDDEQPLRRALEEAFGTSLPAVGDSAVTPRGERLLGLQPDRLYVLFETDEASDPEHALRERLGAEPYLSDQSDAWVMLRIEGRAVRRALERVCPLDLHPEVFAVGAVARSVVEHLGVIVLREAADTFLLLSPRSSARSFLDEIETSVRYVRERT